MTDAPGTDAHDAPRTCAGCGATQVAGAEWCPRCLTRYEPIPVRVAPGPLHHRPVRSRLAGGPTTFGVVGRILLTLPFSLALAVGALAVARGDVINILWMIPVLIVGGFALRDVWERTPKHVPMPPTIGGEPEDPTSPKPILPPDLHGPDS